MTTMVMLGATAMVGGLVVGCSSSGGNDDGDGTTQADGGADDGDASTSASNGDGDGDGDGGPECDDQMTCPPNAVCEDGVCVAVGSMADSVTQYGITWTFDEPHQVGQFVTGDWWVVGPITVDTIDPAPTGDRNGTMLDPVHDQAYDARGGSYDGSKALSLPAQVSPGHSLVSSISHPDTPGCQQGSADGWPTYDGGCQRGPIHTQAVLTVLEAAPPADAFRPAYSSHGKRLYRASDICWSRLPALTPPQDVPEATTLLRHVERPWIDHLGSWTMQHGCATHNMYCYGREIGNIVQRLATYTLLDVPQRDEVAMHLAQIGIDNHGVLRAGGGWGGDGGHFNARKFPIVFGGGLFADAAMASPGVDIGNEDRMTYYGDGGVPRWGRDCDSCYLSNACSYGGSCSGGAKDCRDPHGMIDGCVDYRNCCTSRTWVGEALAVELMGLRANWGHEPFFDYVDRWMAGDVDGGGTSHDDFVDAVWSTHRDATPGVACQ